MAEPHLQPVGGGDGRGLHRQGVGVLLIAAHGLRRLAVYQHLHRLVGHAPEFQGVGPPGGDGGGIALHRGDGEAAFFQTIPGHMGDGGGGSRVQADAVVLIQVKGSVAAREHLDHHGLGVVDAVAVGFQGGHGQDAARFGQHRDVLDAPPEDQFPAAVVDPAVEQVEPLARRQPRLEGGGPGLFVHGPGDGAGDELGAEIVLVGHLVGLGLFRLQVVHGPHQRLAFLTGQPVHGVEIGHQLMAQAQVFLHHRLGNQVVVPGFLAGEAAVGAVQPHDGRKDAQLDPAGGQFIVLVAHHMAADVVAPPAIAHIAGVGGEIGLEVQRFPGDDGIPREAHRIPVAAHAGVAGEGHPPLAVPHAVQIVVVVQHPQGVQAGDFGAGALLPVQPPEVHPVLFLGVVEALEIGFQELGVGDVELDGLAGAPVPAQRLGHGPVGLLKGPDAVRRVNVQRHPQIVLVQPVHEGRRVGEQFFVPGVAGPAAAVLGIHVHQVPVHVDDRHREGHLFLLKPLDQFLVLLVGVAVVAAPPVAQGEPGQHGGIPRQAVKVPQAALVVVAVPEEVQVHRLPFPGLHPAVLPDHQGMAVVQYAIPSPGHHAVVQLHRAVRPVQGAGGAAQVLHRLAVMPDGVVGVLAGLDRQGQAAGGKGLFVVQQLHPFGDDFEGVLGLIHLKGGHRELPVHHALGGAVLKDPRLIVLQPEQPRRQQAEPVFVPLHHRFPAADGTALDLGRFHRQHPFLILHPSGPLFGLRPYYSRLQPPFQDKVSYCFVFSFTLPGAFEAAGVPARKSARTSPRQEGRVRALREGMAQECSGKRGFTPLP